METGDHVLLHCPRTEGVWDQAIEVAGAAVVGTLAEQRWGGMSRASRIGHLLGSRELTDTPTEVILRGAATQALVTGLAFVDAKLKVDREPIRAMAAEVVQSVQVVVKRKRADARAKAKATQQVGPPPQSLVVTGMVIPP